MESLTIMPNFTIMAEVSDKNYMVNLFGYLQCFCEVEANVEHIDTYRITPKSYWAGKNMVPDADFIKIMKDNAKGEIPPNVLTVLEKFESKFGLVTMVGADCLSVKSKDIFTEIKSNTRLNEMIYEYDDEMRLVYFEGDINLIQSILQNDLYCPIKFRNTRMFTFVIWDEVDNHIVNAPSRYQAIRSLYGEHKNINEDNLRSEMNYKKSVVTEEVIQEYIHNVQEAMDDDCSMLQVSNKVKIRPIRF